MPKGYVVLVLHAHLPYVLSHGKWPHGSDWLCEAACETYIPLLNMLGALSKEGRKARLTIGITPVLCEMLAAPLFKSELRSYVAEKIGAASRDCRSFESEGRKEQAGLARRWREFYESRLKDFTDSYGEDLIGAFRRFQEEGQIEVVTSAATHAYLPLLGLDASIFAQVAQGVETYRKHFLKEPRGMWLPECAYCPERDPDGEAGQPSLTPAGPRRKGFETFLAAHGIDYFFVDSCRLPQEEGSATRETMAGREPGAAGGVPSRQYEEGLRSHVGNVGVPYQDREPRVPDTHTDLYAIYRTGRPESGECSFFTRDAATSYQVWSGQWGYPGDPYYLEFHKKHDPGGLRYWRVTDRESDLGTKSLYDPDKARERVRVHADHFKKIVEERLDRYHAETGRTGVLTLPFDAELFGHWWFEGIEWLCAVVTAFDENCAKIEEASAVLQSVPPLGTVSLPEGSWGEGGLHLTWHNKETAWTWECVYDAERGMSDAARVAEGRDEAVAERSDEMGGRILRQMARELLLLESSDWQFLITTGTAADYGRSRFLGHLGAFEELRNMYAKYRETNVLEDAEKEALCVLEGRDAIFDNVNPDWFKERIEDGL